MHKSLQTEYHVGFQHDLICIVFVVVDNKANDEDAAAGVVAAAVLDDAADRMCQILGDDN